MKSNMTYTLIISIRDATNIRYDMIMVSFHLGCGAME